MVSIIGLSTAEIVRALENTNKLFNGNIVFNRFDTIPRRDGYKFEVTLKVKDSKGTGARLGFTGRHMINACWHVYGTFFDECFKINPACKIKQCGQSVTKDNNWTDKNIGSIMQPLLYSDACECRSNGILYKPVKQTIFKPSKVI